MILVLSQLLALVAAAAASVPQPNAQLNTSLGPFQHEVTSVRDGSTLHLAWTEAFWPDMETQPPPGGVGGAFINQTCAFSTSGDRGASWTPPQHHKHRGMVGGNPVVASGGGRVYRVCMGVSDGTVTPFHVAGVFELSVSADGGKIWSPWRVVVDSQGGTSFPDKPWLLVDGADVYISFTRFSQYAGQGNVTVIASHDGGVSFAAPVVLGLGQGSFITQAAAGGPVFVTYVLNQVTQIATSLDRGGTFTVVQGPPLPGVVFPTLTYLRAQVDGSMVLLAASAHYFGPAMMYSRPAGGAWSAGTQLSKRALNAGMSVGTGANVDFVWTECTPDSGGRPGTGPANPGYGRALNGTARTLAASSTDGGVTLQKHISVSDPYFAHCGYPDVPGDLGHGYEVYKGAYQGLVRDDLGKLQLFYIKWGPSTQMERPWGSTVWRAVLQG